MLAKWVLLILLVGIVVSAEKDYTGFVNSLKDAMGKADFKGASYRRLAEFSDSFGPRMWGSAVLELAIENLRDQAKRDGFDNVALEPVVNFTKWVRGAESLTLYSPRTTPTRLEVIGLGHSVSGKVRANVVVVNDWEELDSLKQKVAGKIVLFNPKWHDYDTSVDYRANGASRAAKYGALAALVRSVTPQSIESVHAGAMVYAEGSPKIPTAAITTEDADMFARMQKRGQTITVELDLQSFQVAGTNSNNLVFELRGTTFPEQVILMGGHIDSWDTGSQTGANDDGGGFMTVYEALRLLKNNGFRPKRTLRFIAWSGEEFGDAKNGAHQYVSRHESEIEKHIAVFESDEGSRKLIGFGFSGNATARQLLNDISSKYLSLINCNFIGDDGEEADSADLFERGVPMLKNIVEDTVDQQFYFTYHHTRGDSMSIMNPDQMDSNVLGIAVLTYILADLENTIGRT